MCHYLIKCQLCKQKRFVKTLCPSEKSTLQDIDFLHDKSSFNISVLLNTTKDNIMLKRA